MRYEDSMVKIAKDIIRDQEADIRIQNRGTDWHDEYATLNFFRYVCKRVGNLREREIQILVRNLKQSDPAAVAKHGKGDIWVFDYDKMYSALVQNPVCQKVCQKNKYTNWMQLISRYCVEDC